MSQSYSNTVTIIGFYIPQKPENYDERKRIQLLLKEDYFRSSYTPHHNASVCSEIFSSTL